MGLSTLTHQSAYDKGIVDGFIGNVFDFISISEEHIDLDYVAALMPFFATFFFDGLANARAFEELIEASLGEQLEIYACSIEQYDLNRLSQLVRRLIAI